MTANLNLLLEKHGPAFLEAAIKALVGRGVDCVGDDAQYRESVILPAWQAAPMQFRLFEPAQLRWEEFIFALRDEVFDASGGVIALQPGWQQAIGRLRTEFTTPADDWDDRLRLPAAGSDSVPLPLPPGAKIQVVGIDLGTTYSVVAYLDHQGRPVSISNASGDILTPSVVLFDQDGSSRPISETGAAEIFAFG